MTPEKPVECRRASGWMVDRAYGELSGKKAARLEAHLAACPDCAAGARETGSLAAMRPAVDVAELLSPRVRQQVEDLRVTEAAHRVGAFAARVVLAFVLAIVSSQVVMTRPALAALSMGMTMLIVLAWTVIYTWLLDQVLGEVSPDRHITLDARSVAYGVLSAVALSIVLLGGFLAGDGALHAGWTVRAARGLPDVVALLSSGALLFVGLGMGMRLGRASSPNMLLVLLLYAGIMFPALSRKVPALLHPEDLLFGLGFVALWGLSGAYLGSLLSEARHVESPRTASL
jgi:anti-sigma factor RsiW